MFNVIDPHLHFFALQQGQYGWLKAENPPHWPDKHKLMQGWGESDLTLPEAMHLKGFVHIEAGFDNNQPWREIEWLQQHCTLPFRAVAFADITGVDFEQQLEKLAAYSSVVGIRHILEDAATEILAHGNVPANLQLLAEKAWLFEAQLDLADGQGVMQLTRLMDAFPKLTIVVNHAGFGWQNSNEAPWQQGLALLAAYPQCSIKCSGWEMQNRQWQAEEISPFIEHIVQGFGVGRVMLASNFPVSELGRNYKSLWQTYMQLPFSESEKEQLFYMNAKRVYSLNC